MGWRMLSRQCFHGKHTLASHYTLSDIRGSLLARGTKMLESKLNDFEYCTNVIPELMLLPFTVELYYRLCYKL
ncbi:hypothetical protein APICC_04474 [Apis cerana cerana]|uniref:Uncharacterized protein n=1 Tax=Apis cerana cerana TaxID=94128 RepID=A0A2A3E4P9_APICC|nr:hypothetical protein APICC_04474 [Apis cerana cerana]